MSERYTRVFSLDGQYYTEGSPVIIKAGALLKDNVENRMIAQIKFENIVSKIIKAVVVEFSGKDTWGNTVFEKLSFQYLDLCLNKNEETGAKIPVVFKDETVRSFSVKVIKVAFDEDEAWMSDKEFELIPKAMLLTDKIKDDRLLKGYHSIHGVDKEIIPFVFKDIWFCGCYTVNSTGHPCVKCGREYSDLVAFLDEKVLESEIVYRKANRKLKFDNAVSLLEASNLFASIEEYKDSKELSEKYAEMSESVRKNQLYNQAYRQLQSNTLSSLKNAQKDFSSLGNWKDSEERVLELGEKIKNLELEIAKNEKENAEKKRKAKRNAIIVFVLAIVTTAMTFLTINYIIPTMRYNEALELYQNNQFEAAIEQFKALGDFKDSADKVFEVKYSQAEYLLDANEFDASISIFNELGHYLDSDSKVVEATFEKGKWFLESDDYLNAYQTLSSIKDSSAEIKEMFVESAYLCGVDSLSKNSYSVAISSLNAIYSEKYLDTIEKLDEAYYKYAEELLNAKDYENARKNFLKMSKVDRTDKVYLESTYQYAIKLNDRTGISMLEAISSYKDAKTKIKEIKYSYVMKNLNNKNYTTYEYLKELKKAGYKDSNEIYKELYAWKMNVVTNSSESDNITNISVFKVKSPLYVHLSMNGGTPGETTDFKEVIIYPDGSVDSSWWGIESSANQHMMIYWENGIKNAGTMSFKFYDESGNLIGSHSIRITN